MSVSVSMFPGKHFSVPLYDREFVEQATKPIWEVLALEEKDCCNLILTLEKDHSSISQMCKDALVPLTSKNKIPQKYKISLLTSLSLSTVLSGIVGYFSVVNKVSNFVVAFLGLFAAITAVVYISKGDSEEVVDLRKGDIKIKACAEKVWLHSKQPKIDNLYTEMEDKVTAMESSDYDNQENKKLIVLRDQLLLLKAYVDQVVGKHKYDL